MSAIVRLAQFSLGPIATSPGTKFLLIFHTEGLVNERVRKAMLGFGRQASGTFTPIATLITPDCPQYTVDPLTDPRRTSFPMSEPTQGMRDGFRDTLDELREYYEIGYHGHFFSLAGGRFSPAFDSNTIRGQVLAELNCMADAGVRPRVYAGGWWFISMYLVRLLESHAFRIDTSVNDVGLDTFNRPQPFTIKSLGQPFRLGDSMVEFPTFRSVRGMMAAARRGAGTRPSIIPIALHDYDIVAGSTSLVAQKLLVRLTKKEKLATFSDLLHAAAHLENHPSGEASVIPTQE